MNRLLSAYAEHVYALTRIGFGALFACHGLKTVFGLLGGEAQAIGSLFWVAGVIELVTGVLVAIGFQARLAAFIASGQMAVAYFMVHQGRGCLPIQNGGELAVLYSWVFLAIAARGAGLWAIKPDASPSQDA